MIRRKLLNFGPYSTDYRSGFGALGELSKLLAGAVGRPRRAFLVRGEDVDEDVLTRVRHSITDAGYRFDEWALAPEHACSFGMTGELLGRLSASGLTSEDLLVALGDARVCSLAAFTGRMWCGGASVALIPTTLDAMVSTSTQMRPLMLDTGADLVDLKPEVALVVCDLDLVQGASIERNGLGYALLTCAHLAESRKCWNGFEQTVAGILSGDAISLADAVSTAQTSRLNTAKSASPSSRRAFMYGTVAARALAACLDEPASEYQLLSEGMRFEARLAVDACGFDVEDMFAQDDRLEDFGIAELAFEVEPDAFVSALRAERFARANRFQLALPKHPGIIRLTSVDDDVLERHARAFTASRRP